MEFKDYFSSIKNLNNILNNFFEQIPEELNFPPNKNIEVPKKWRNENKSNLLKNCCIILTSFQFFSIEMSNRSNYFNNDNKIHRSNSIYLKKSQIY